MPLLILWWLLLYGTYSQSWPRPFDDWKNLLFYFGGGVAALFILWRQKKSITPFRLSSPSLLFFLYLFWALFSIRVPTYEGFLALFSMLIWGGLVYFLTQVPKEKIVELMGWAVVAATFICWFAFLQMKEIFVWGWMSYSVMPIGYVAYFADFTALHLPMALYLFAQTKSRTQKIIWAGCFISLLFGVWLSQSRTALLAVVTAFLFGAILWSLKKRVKISYAAGIFIFLISIFFVFHRLQPTGLQYTSAGNRLIQIFSIKNKSLDEIFAGRWVPYRNTLDMIREKPMQGWGIGSYHFVYPEFAPRRISPWFDTTTDWFMHPHSEILNQLAEVGVLGFLIFTGFFAYLFWGGITKFLKSKNQETQSRMLTSLMGLAIALIYWQFNTTYLYPLSRLLSAFYIASILREGVFRQINFPVPGKFLRRMPIAIAIFATIMVTGYHVSLFAAKKSWEAVAQEERARWAVYAYHLAPLAYDPYYTYVGAFLYTPSQEKVRGGVEKLYRQFPYLSSVLARLAFVRKEEGNSAEAIRLMEHASRNAPQSKMFKELLERWRSETVQ